MVSLFAMSEYETRIVLDKKKGAPKRALSLTCDCSRCDLPAIATTAAATATTAAVAATATAAAARLRL